MKNILIINNLHEERNLFTINILILDGISTAKNMITEEGK